MDKLRLKEWERFTENIQKHNDSGKIQYLVGYVKELLFRVMVLEDTIDNILNKKEN